MKLNNKLFANAERLQEAKENYTHSNRTFKKLFIKKYKKVLTECNVKKIMSLSVDDFNNLLNTAMKTKRITYSVMDKLINNEK